MLNRKIKQLLIGSNNPGKIKEIRDLLPNNIEIFAPADLNIKSPIEDGKSFEENSLLKARFFSKKTKMICLADDSGLEIDILNGKPGIFSARWGGKKNDFKKAIKKVYKELKKVDPKWKLKKIKARFICALTIFYSNKKYSTVIGKVEGRISKKAKGLNGFGYDPIFIPNKKKITFAQMKPNQKYKIDHRYKAFRKIKKFF
jgi:XTP/dITP diphosphohydrolase